MNSWIEVKGLLAVKMLEDLPCDLRRGLVQTRRADAVVDWYESPIPSQSDCTANRSWQNS